MYLSSRFAACVGIAAVLTSGAACAELAARPVFAGMRPTMVTRGPHRPFSGPAVIGRHDGYPGAGIRPTLVPRVRRGYGYGGYGVGYDGYGNADFGGPSIYPPPPDPIAAPPPFAIPAPPAPGPQIIEINGGLAHKVTTRVISGTPCRR